MTLHLVTPHDVPLTPEEEAEAVRRAGLRGHAFLSRINKRIADRGMPAREDCLDVQLSAGVLRYRLPSWFTRDIPPRVIFDALGVSGTDERRVADLWVEGEVDALLLALPKSLRATADWIDERVKPGGGS